MQHDLLRLVPGDGGGDALHGGRHLVTGPQLDAVVANNGDRVERFERLMRDIRCAILGLDHPGTLQRAFHVALAAPDLVDVVRRESGSDGSPVLGLLGRIVGGRSPLALHRIRGLHCIPGIGRDDGKSVGDRQDLLHPWHALGLARVE